jgi:hypothetical protein
MSNKNKLIAIQCLSLSDIASAIYSYMFLSNLEQFKKMVSGTEFSESPQFIFELYQVFLQTFIFIAIVILLFHLIVYFFYFRGKKFAELYVKYYSIFAGLSLIIFGFLQNQIVLLVPGFLYLIGFYYIAKKTAAPQT